MIVIIKIIKALCVPSPLSLKLSNVYIKCNIYKLKSNLLLYIPLTETLYYFLIIDKEIISL